MLLLFKKSKQRVTFKYKWTDHKDGQYVDANTENETVFMDLKENPLP